jgi:endonuclease III
MSPFTLLQEELQRDPWKIFICCIFCNLTKRVHAEPYFWKVLKKWPSPKAMATANAEELETLIKPLGLARRRAKALIVYTQTKIGEVTPASCMGSESMVQMHITSFAQKSGEV